MTGEPVQVKVYDGYCKVILSNSHTGNKINTAMIQNIHEAIDRCTKTIMIIEGGEEVFCEGADFNQIIKEGDTYNESCARQMYQLWLRMRKEPIIFISHVKGRVSAGGMGFIAASDIVISNELATYALSELLFGLYPACVLPFLIHKIGFQKSHYMTLMTKKFTAQQAYEMGLVDCVAQDSERMLNIHIQRLKYLKYEGIKKYKVYLMNFCENLKRLEEDATMKNKEMFLNENNREAISKFMYGQGMPWE